MSRRTVNENVQLSVGFRMTPRLFEKSAPMKKVVSWLKVPLADTVAGFLVAVVLIAMGSYIVYVNENKAASAWWYTQHVVHHVVKLANIDVVYAENNDNLVFIHGPLQSKKLIRDDEFNVAVHATKLKRVVSLFQWTMHKEMQLIDTGDAVKREEVNVYKREWRSHLVKNLIDKSYANPTRFPFPSKNYSISNVNVGAFQLSPNLFKHIDNYRPLDIHSSQIKMKLPNKKLHRLSDYTLFYGRNPDEPEVGDIKVEYFYAGAVVSEDINIAADLVSILAKQHGNQLTRFSVRTGDWLEILSFGYVSPTELILRVKYQSHWITWLYRAFGSALTVVGFIFSTFFLSTLNGSLEYYIMVMLMNGRGHAGLCLGFATCCVMSAFAWFQYKNTVSIICTSLAISFIVFIKPKYSHQQKCQNTGLKQLF